jgi:hypothetical protein
VANKLENSHFRFAAGSPDGNRSGIWRFWTQASNDDVYFAARAAASDFKVSLHQSGRWRAGFTKPDSPFLPKGADRAVHKWSRPAELAPGWTRAFEVGIPASEVTPPKLPGAKLPAVCWLSEPPAGHAVHVDIFFAASDADLTDWPGKVSMGTYPIHHALLARGETIVLLAHAAKVADDVARNIDDYKGRILALGEDDHVDLDSVGDPRGFLIGTIDEDQTPFFMDLAL